jgi:hAT family C-terminal dimerisation region
VKEYQGRNPIPSPSPPKRLYSAIDNEDEDDEFEKALQSVASLNTSNEYDRYISSLVVVYKIAVLEWWRQNEREFSDLSLMVRDTMAVPATGAGVERQFSHSGRIVTPLRNRLTPVTVKEVMMYKCHLERRQKEFLNLFENGGAMLVESERAVEEPPYLKEWKNQWWKERKRQDQL